VRALPPKLCQWPVAPYLTHTKQMAEQPRPIPESCGDAPSANLLFGRCETFGELAGNKGLVHPALSGKQGYGTPNKKMAESCQSPALVDK